MIEIITPDRVDILRLQRDDGAYYWSIVAEMLFRERGLLSVCTRVGEVSSDARAVVFTRGVGAGLAAAAPIAAFRFYEGPLDPASARAEGIEVEAFTAGEVRLSAEGLAEANLYYPHEYFRGATAEAIELKDPPFWHKSTISGQFLNAPGWQVLATAIAAGSTRERPVVIGKGSVVACGLPLFDLAARLAAFAPLPSRYEKKLATQAVPQALSWAIEAIARGSLAAGAAPIVRVRRWPVGKTAAFTVRHDFDRAVPLELMSSLLEYYEERGVKASIGFLDRTLPADVVRRCVAGGHEVQMHSDAASAEAFSQAARNVGTAAGAPIRGMTVHGGSSGPGFLGDTHYGWAEAQKLSYVERFSFSPRDHVPLPRIDEDGVPCASSLIGVRHHFSLDKDYKSNNLPYMYERIPPTLEAGGYVILMNYPDLHRSELLELIDSLDLRNVWRATQAEVAEWFDSTHFKACIEAKSRGVVNFHTVLAQDVEITLEWSEGRISKIRGRGPRLELCRNTPGAPSTFLLSDGEAAAANDAKAVGKSVRMVALRGGAQLEDAHPSRPVNLFSTILSPGWWAGAERLILGKSLLAELSPELMGGSIAAIEAVTGRALTADAEPEAALRGRPNAGRLGDWMVRAVHDAGSDTVSLKELEYFIGSGGCRGHALSKVLCQYYSGRYPTVVDFGPGIGLLSHILALDSSFGIRQTILVELVTRYANTAENLWHGGPAMRFERSAAEDFVPAQPTDIALYCQMIFRIPPSKRHALFLRVWDLLRPHGLLIVNELIQENVVQQYVPPLLTRDELVGLLLPFGRPCLYRVRNNTIILQEPEAAPTQDYGSHTFLIARKPG